MILVDFIVNLSVFSLLICTPLVLRSFMNHIPNMRFNLSASLYAGLVSVVLVMLAVEHQGYTYDIRYVPVILAFSYFGPVPGIVTGIFSLLTRLYSGGNWPPAIIGWTMIMLALSVVHHYVSRISAPRRMAVLFGTYAVGYLVTIFTFRILLTQPLFHLQYLLFVLLGVIFGGLLIESNERLLKMIKDNKAMQVTLEASESKYKLIANNTSDLIMVMDQDHSLSYFSPSHEVVLGYSHQELENIRLCKFVHPEDVDRFNAAITAMFADQQPTTMEFRLKHKEGHWIEFESRCRPVQGNQHIVVISRDLSDRKKAEEILLQSEKLSIVGELAAGIAHEIRNPLTTIKGFLQVYREDPYPKKHNDLLLSELERIEAITSELLALAKPQIAQLTQADVRDLVEYTVGILAPQALLNQIEFQLSFEPASFPITCEKNQLKQMLLNILKNAMESMPAGGEIQIGLRRDGAKACIVSVQDQGCGIPEELFSKLGQPFYSLKERGTGLGLMISHKIIKQHQGDIIYQSKLNEGTLIEIRLPLMMDTPTTEELAI